MERFLSHKAQIYESYEPLKMKVYLNTVGKVYLNTEGKLYGTH